MSRTGLVLIVAAGVLLTACVAAGPSAPAAAVAPATKLRVGLTEWDITTNATRLAAGIIELTVTNAGSTVHDLQVTTEHDATATTRLLEPGEQQQLAFDAPQGAAVELSCTVPGHAAQGMHVSLAVD